MCGITGIFHLNGKGNISLDTLQRMTGALYHRGPDECGIYVDRWVGLGSARLSIIDLSSGLQPIHNEDQTMWIVYNGEVFNYLELKKELQRKGHQFYTTSDTEVILHLYEEKGPALLEDLNGQFAFAIWDAKEKELFLARDRVGIRPLHYAVKDNLLIFASEVKSIFMCEQITREIDPIAMGQIFTLWTTLPGRTVFKGVYELPPGHYLKASRGHVTVNRYWDIPLYPREEYLGLPVEEISQQIQQLLRDAVRIRLRADVPVGCYLSGGLDSSGVTALVVKNFDSDVRTFGIRFEQGAYDEGKYQEKMVSFLKAHHTELQATNEKIGTCFPEVLWHCEKPLLRTAPVPLFLLSQLVRQNNLKVVLTGEGGDEVFGGYNIFKEAKVRRFWSRQPDSLQRRQLFSQLYPYIFSSSRAKSLLQSFFTQNIYAINDPLFSHIIRWENTSKTKTFFSDRLKAEIGSYVPYEEIRQNLPSLYEQCDTVTKAQYLEMAIFLSNYLLSSQGDRVAMAHSVEIRMPYLDYRIIDFMARVPSKWKILGLNEKYILKKSFRHILPEEVLSRPKHPYRAPIKESLLNHKTSEFTKEMLSEKAIKKVGLFDVAKVDRLLKKLQVSESASEVDNMALVGILSSQLIYHQFVENFPSRTYDSVSPNVIIDRRAEVYNKIN